MSARDKAQGTPQRSSSLSSSTYEGKRREKDPMDSEAKQRKPASTGDCTSQPLLTACASQPSAHPSVAGPSSINIPAASPPPDVERMRMVKLSRARLSSLSDPLDDLDTFTASQTPGETVADVAFQKALDEFAGHFHGEEELGDPLSERLASILNVSLR
ncbi:hypothetical protein E2C01_076848 [Portunus trituberculatus]|uniref:Uncharacterized protein n=1 Tax=Portunus trituberculatus TaxID=210409 RepID=A0A5B7ICU8_PORTR|nr:hypothetical protein [Portunus trituberculatus]